MLWLKYCDKLGEMVYFHHSTRVVCQDSRGFLSPAQLSDTVG